MKKVLIITYSQDNECIKMVSEEIKKKGGIAVRFNTDTFPGESKLVLHNNNGKWKNILQTIDGEFLIDKFESIWYRRLRIAENLKAKVEKKFLGPSVEESRRTFFGMLNCLDIFHMDNFHKIRKSEVKQLQLKFAEQQGLKIPKTLITNNPDEVREFYKSCKNGIISKMQSSFAIYENDEENVVFTNELKKDDLKNLDDLIYCPMQFQEKIEKKLELRVTVIGDKVFAASIDSQISEKSKIDWRKQGIEMVNDWKPYILPEEIEIKLLKMMDFYKINYGAADFIITPEDEYYFLEINPTGEFFWLEKSSPYFPLSSSIADVLLGESERRI